MEYYNQEQKQRWLDHTDLSKYPKMYWERLLMKTKPYEESLNKDLCNFNKVEIREMYLGINYMSFETLLVDNYSLQKYAMWAIQNALIDDGINHYGDFTSDELIQCVNMRQIKNSIVAYDDVMSGIRKLENAQDQFIILALFEGIRGKSFDDIRLLKIEDIHDGKAFLRSGRVVKISQRLADIAQLANNEYVYHTADNRDYKMVGDCILKVSLSSYSRTAVQERSLQNIYKAFMRCIEVMGWSDQVSANSLYISGTIHMINQLAKENECSGKDVIWNDALYNTITEQYEFDRKLRKRFCLKYGDLLV